ncbi:MAG: hypothetical protein IOD05_10275 [Rhodobacter sp.]|nr:hypothetical protein [Rhodobacter sp.]MCA3492076.1 hypothetical protein [Rhodobacter sp.]MCA3499188.1 hypothetical protein [Rhodobacter sp.]MCA3503614.1 hypothetical protein [Rhodobacter sp.]MCA3516839.1 hypothetical protein [Rhodobacter sp.]
MICIGLSRRSVVSGVVTCDPGFAPRPADAVVAGGPVMPERIAPSLVRRGDGFHPAGGVTPATPGKGLTAAGARAAARVPVPIRGTA